MGDAISHAVLPGVVIAYLFNIPLIIGAFCAGMFCALATGFLSENCRVKQDTVMGIVFSGMFGFGIVLYTKITTDVHLDHILFGKGSIDLVNIAKLRCKKISTKHKVKNFRRTFLGTIITDQMSIYEYDCEVDE